MIGQNDGLVNALLGSFLSKKDIIESAPRRKGENHWFPNP